MQGPRQFLRALPRREQKAPARGQQVRGRSGQRVPARPGQQPVAPFQGARDIFAELKKVTWPSREQAVNLTGVVIIVSVAVGLVLGGADYLFYWLIDGLLHGLGA